MYMRYVLYQSRQKFGHKKMILLNESARVRRAVLEAQGYNWVGSLECEVPYKELVEGFKNLKEPELCTAKVGE